MVSCAPPRDEDFQNLVPDALPRQDRKPARSAPEAASPSASGSPSRVFRVEAEEPQDPQVILANARPRVADEADAAGGEIGDAVGIIVKLPVETEREGIDGEIAAPGIGGEIAPEMHDRPAARRFPHPRAGS